MKKIITKFFLVLSFIALLFALPSVVLAASTSPLWGSDDKLPQNIVLGKDEVAESLYLKTGETLTINGTVKNDAYLFGGIVTFDGKVEGNLIIGGGVVTVKGEVVGDLWVGGGMVTIDSKIGRNLNIAGGNITIGTDTTIGGNLMGAGGNFDFSGETEKEAKIGAGNLNLGGKIKGNTEVAADSLTVNKEAEIQGDLTYTVAKEKSQIDENAKIEGTVTQKEPSIKVGKEGLREAKKVLGIIKIANFGFKVFWFLGLLLVGLLLVLITPRQVSAVGKIISEKPLPCLGLGFALPFVLLAVFVLLMITLIGIPLALILTGGFFLMFYLSPIFISIFIGQKLFEKKDRKISLVWLLLGGLLIWEVVTLLPYVGGLIKIIGIFLAWGGMLLFAKEALGRLKLKEAK